jgi:hypothetical protein
MPVDPKGGKPSKNLKKVPPPAPSPKAKPTHPAASQPKAKPASPKPPKPKARPVPRPGASSGGAMAKTPAHSSAAGFVPLDRSADAEIGAEITALGDRINGLADDVALNSHKGAMADLDSGIAELSEEAARIRSRGYVYKNYLERKLETLQQKWADARPRLESALRLQEPALSQLYNQAAQEFNNAAGLGVRANSRLAAVTAKVNNLESRVQSARSTLDSIYSNVRETFYQTRGQIAEVTWLLDALDESPLELLANENPIQGVNAHWWRDGKKEGPKGVLILSDQRLLFEQKEKVATKKILFVTTESETIQAVLMAVAVTDIETCVSSHAGLGGHQDHLEFTFTKGDYVNAHFHIEGQESDGWAALVKRVLNSDIQRERFYPEGTDAATVSALEEAAMSEAPAECESCGAPLDPEIVRGQRSIQCEYCGTVMRW